MTPEALFEGLAKDLHDLKKVADAEEKHRDHWLNPATREVEEDIQQRRIQGQDRHGCDPDAFARPTDLKKPANWAEVVQRASFVRFRKVLFVDCYFGTYL